MASGGRSWRSPSAARRRPGVPAAAGRGRPSTRAAGTGGRSCVDALAWMRRAGSPTRGQHRGRQRRRARPLRVARVPPPSRAARRDAARPRRTMKPSVVAARRRRGASPRGSPLLDRRRRPRSPSCSRTRRSPSPPSNHGRRASLVEGDLAGIVARTTTTTTTTTADPDGTGDDGGSRAGGRRRRCASSPTARSTTRASWPSVLDGDLPTAVDSVDRPGHARRPARRWPSTSRRPPPSTVPGALTLRRPGLYPLTVELLVDGERVAEHVTFVERLPVEDGIGAADERGHRRRRARPRAGADRRRRSPTAASARRRSPSWRRRSTGRSPCSSRPSSLETSTAATRRSPRRCATRSTATRCWPCRPTCSTRRRPWRSTPRSDFARELRSGEDVPDRRPAVVAPAAGGVARDHADQHRRRGDARRPRLPQPRRSTRRSTPSSTATSAGTTTTRSAVDVDLGDRGSLPAMVVDAGRRAARPGARSNAATWRPPTPPCGSSPSW